MTVSTSPASQSSTAPTGWVQPTHERALLALKAINESRWADADKHVAAIPESPLCEYAWKAYLAGRLAAERHDFPAAEARFLEAASAALASGLGDEKQASTDAMRLGAAAMEKLGCAYRRQERLDDAHRSHRAAYRLRQEHGSVEERWESAMSLAVDCTVARRDEEAERWCRVAIDLAAAASDQPTAKQAQAWGRLSPALTSLRRHEEAVAAARTAREFWRTHDLAAVTAARADLEVAQALMKFGESLYESDAPAARTILSEALESLATAAEELPPFGPEAAADARRSAELTDFVRRLLESL
jgi:tetratricopeptide (TPR) repeat protein